MGDWHLVERKGRRMSAADPQRPEGHFALGYARIPSTIQHRSDYARWVSRQSLKTPRLPLSANKCSR
jgi:hypothetical protein